MSIEEAKRRFPQWSPERLKEMAEAEDAALDATGGLLAVSPEILGEMFNEGGIEAVKQHFADHAPADVVAMAQSIVNDNTSPESPAPEKRSSDVDKKATRSEGSGQAPEGYETGKERDPARGVQPGSTRRGKARKAEPVRKQRTDRPDSQPPQAERVMPTGSHPKMINSPSDVAKILPPMARPAHDKEACRNKYCLICHPPKES